MLSNSSTTYTARIIFSIRNVKLRRKIVTRTRTVRSTVVELPQDQVHQEHTVSAEYPQWWSHQVSCWTTAYWDEYSREPPHFHTAAHPTEDHWETNRMVGHSDCSQFHSSSHYQRREELEHYYYIAGTHTSRFWIILKRYSNGISPDVFKNHM